MAGIRAKTRGVSLFPNHEAIVAYAAAMRGLQGNTFSPAIQFILMDWAQLRGVPSHILSDDNMASGSVEIYPSSNPTSTVLRDSS